MTEFNIIRAIVFGVALACILSYTVWVLYKMLNFSLKGQKDPERFESLGYRLLVMLKGVFGQDKVLKKRAGLGHLVIFYGFIVITVIASEVFIRALIPEFSYLFLGFFYDWLLFFEDILSIGVIVALSIALIRRKLPSIRLEGSKRLRKDMYLIIFVVGAHVILSNILESMEIALGDHPFLSKEGSIIGPFLAFGLSNIWSGIDLEILFEIVWYLHAMSIWLFLLYIVGSQVNTPLFFPSKHFHVISAPFNVYFSNLKPSGRLRPIDFEDDAIEQYGTQTLKDLTWKQKLDLYTCTGCGRCQEVCPAYLNDEPLSPKSLILDMRQHALESLTAELNGSEVSNLGFINGDVIKEETIWACTTCNACQVACPLYIEHIDKIIDMRRNNVMMESKFPKELQKMFNNLEVNSNPWGIGKSDRDLWAKGLGLKYMHENPEIDTLFWVGCAGSFDEKAKKISSSLVKILNSAKIEFAILGKNEKCTGDPARRLGNEYLASELIAHNVQLLNEYKFKEIITFCPHCFNSIANEFPDFGGHYKVMHASEYVASLLKQNKLNINKNLPLNITYHDSCYLGRHNGIYTAPREILKMVGIEVKEMDMSKESGMCCGAGGGRIWFELEKEGGTDINNTRAKMAADTKAEYLGVSCPFCTIMLEDGVKNIGQDLKVIDLIQIVADRVIDEI